MMHILQRIRTLIARDKVAALAVVLALAIVIYIATFSSLTQKSFSSAEVKFTDASKGGLAIVPASCPSNPYDYPHNTCTCPDGYTGTYPNCTPANGSGTCFISANWDRVDPGRRTTLTWSTADYSWGLFTISPGEAILGPGVGPVAPTGSQQMQPEWTTTYRLSGTYKQLGIEVGSFSCSKTIYVNTFVCGAPRQVIDGVCRCASSYTYDASDNTCTFDECPAGQGRDPARSSTCHVLCPPAYTVFALDDDVAQCSRCVAHAGSLCRAYNSCGMPGNAALFSCNGTCAGTPPSEDLCVAAPQIVTWRVNPLLLQIDSKTFITWDTIRTQSCSVSGSNGDGKQTAIACPAGWCEVSGTRLESQPITGQTAYTLTCIGDDFSTISTSTIINVTPIFNES